MIYITHGAVDHWDPHRISHGLMLAGPVLARHLENRTTKYVPLMEALAGEGDALTIDDATYAGLRAALLARRYGHAVSWFVNGLNVERRLAYFPFQLSWMLDQTDRTTCAFHGQYWDLSQSDRRRGLRQCLKHSYMRMRSTEAIVELVREFSVAVAVDPAGLDEALATVTSNDLKRAVDAGVELRNHGWAHLNPQTLPERELIAEFQRNEAYLSHFGQAGAGVFAPPFGRPVAAASGVASCVLLADRSFHSNGQNGSFVNRYDLQLADGMPAEAKKIQCLAQTA